MSRAVWFSRYTSQSNGLVFFPAVSLVTTIHSACLGILKPRSAQKGVSCDQMIVQYTHDEYCDMLLTLGISNSRPGTATREYAQFFPGRRHPDADVLMAIGTESP